MSNASILVQDALPIPNIGASKGEIVLLRNAVMDRGWPGNAAGRRDEWTDTGRPPRSHAAFYARARLG